MHKEFEVHMLNESGIDRAKNIAMKFNELVDDLQGLGISGGREAAIMRTKLEEACFFAKKAIANDPINQK